jgi:hypothetical protein
MGDVVGMVFIVTDICNYVNHLFRFARKQIFKEFEREGEIFEGLTFDSRETCLIGN